MSRPLPRRIIYLRRLTFQHAERLRWVWQNRGTWRRGFRRILRVLTSVIGHADRAKPLRDYCTGLMMPCDRKSVEPMAAITAPDRTAAQHQSLLHFVGQGDWSDQQVLAKVREYGAAGASNATGRSKLGSSMIRAFPRRGGIRSGLHGNIAASWASKTIVRSP